MFDWTDFCRRLDFAALVPETLARYRPAVAEGLAFFLENLPSGRTVAILAEQATMPEDTGIDERLVAMARHCPALHKLGQVMARDRRLPPSFRSLLQRLETMAPADDLAWIGPRLERELGPLSALGVRLDGAPLAEASAAVVVPFIGPGGVDGEETRGVFKLLKPGIEDRLNEELDLLQRVGALLDDRCHHHDLPRIAYEETFAEVRDLLRMEVHLDREQAHMQAARTAYASMASVIVPEVYAFSTPRVTAMQRIDGAKVTDADTMPALRHGDLADLIVESLLARPIWSTDPVTLFHADPHAGNMLVTADGRLALLDWSLTGTLTKVDRIGLTQILLGALTRDVERICAAVAQLATGAVDTDVLRRVVGDRLHRGAGIWPGLAWLTALMDDVVIKARARFGPNLMIFRKVLQTLDGVVADVSEDCRPDRVLAASFFRQFGLEWGLRAFVPPYSRAFATHLSTTDLAELVLSAPFTASRYSLDLFAGTDPVSGAGGLIH